MLSTSRPTHRNRTGRRHGRRGAFTLLELIVVIVVLGILSSIAIVGYRALISRSQDAAAQATVASVLREASALAAFDLAVVPLPQHFAEALDDLPGAAAPGVAASNYPSPQGRWTVTDATPGVNSEQVAHVAYEPGFAALGMWLGDGTCAWGSVSSSNAIATGVSRLDGEEVCVADLAFGEPAPIGTGDPGDGDPGDGDPGDGDPGDGDPGDGDPGDGDQGGPSGSAATIEYASAVTFEGVGTVILVGFNEPVSRPEGFESWVVTISDYDLELHLEETPMVLPGAECPEPVSEFDWCAGFNSFYGDPIWPGEYWLVVRAVIDGGAEFVDTAPVKVTVMPTGDQGAPIINTLEDLGDEDGGVIGVGFSSAPDAPGNETDFEVWLSDDPLNPFDYWFPGDDITDQGCPPGSQWCLEISEYRGLPLYAGVTYWVTVTAIVDGGADFLDSAPEPIELVNAPQPGPPLIVRVFSGTGAPYGEDWEEIYVEFSNPKGGATEFYVAYDPADLETFPPSGDVVVSPGEDNWWATTGVGPNGDVLGEADFYYLMVCIVPDGECSEIVEIEFDTGSIMPHLPPPAAPTTVTLEPAPGGILVEWDGEYHEMYVVWGLSPEELTRPVEHWNYKWPDWYVNSLMIDNFDGDPLTDGATYWVTVCAETGNNNNDLCSTPVSLEYEALPPPPAPTVLSAEGSSSDGITVQWTENTSGFDLIVEWADSPGKLGGWDSNQEWVPGSETEFTFHEYMWSPIMAQMHVRVCLDAFFVSCSEPFASEMTYDSTAPSSLSVVPDGMGITVSWAEGPAASVYAVYYEVFVTVDPECWDWNCEIQDPWDSRWTGYATTADFWTAPVGGPFLEDVTYHVKVVAHTLVGPTYTYAGEVSTTYEVPQMM